MAGGDEVNLAKGSRTVTVDKHGGSLPIGRIALVVAALVALVAIGISVWKRRADAPPPVVAASAAPGGDIAQRIAEIEAQAKASPQDPEVWRRLGWAYYGTERFTESANAYRQATKLDPKNVDSWSALGEAIALAGARKEVPAEAEAAFRKALSLDPADARARYFLAVKKDLAGDHEGAITDWIALLKDTPAGGAPWESSVRDTVMQVAQANKIDVSKRLPPLKTPAEPAAPGASAATDAIPGPTREQMAAASSLPPGQQDAMVNQMVESLAGKLKANPRDADGWLRLMRARMVLGQTAQASQALNDGKAAFAGDAATQARLTDGAKQLGVPGA